jgi:uncharacterized protein YqjF (DUF2071 family)
MPQTGRLFLTAEWRDLLILNYQVDPAQLRAYVPPGTELDSFAGRTYLSLVGFRFCKTKYRSFFSIPFHSEFEEVNLRIYVRRSVSGEIRRGVAFIAEIVPSFVVAKAARWFYGENYMRRPITHRVECQATPKSVAYRWQEAAGWCELSALFRGQPAHPQEGSLEQFISEHYWGYSGQKDGTSLEYRVDHVPWKIWTAWHAGFCGDASNLYGKELSAVLRNPPASAFVAEGSLVTVYDGGKLT